jgi:TPP-dependent pyruvate/acetoin dehydrogenase alpha subunit
LIKNRILKKEDLRRINQEVEAEVKEAHRCAKVSSYPRPNELAKYVFKE